MTNFKVEAPDRSQPVDPASVPSRFQRSVLDLYPAYGRVYLTEQQGLDSWDANEDWTPFKFGGGAYISKKDVLAQQELHKLGYTHIALHFNRRVHVAVYIEVPRVVSKEG